MAESTGITWCDSTFNPWMGCTRVSPACDHCYAAVSSPARTLGIEWGPGKPRRRTADSNWRQVSRWNSRPFVACASCNWRGEMKHFKGSTGWTMCPVCSGADWHGARRRVFCASLGDVFDNEVPAAWRAELFALISCTPNLDWLLLTKRVGNVGQMLLQPGMPVDGLPRNVWLGITVCNQDEAVRDFPKLQAIDAAVRFVSYEPALGPLDLFEVTLSRTRDGPPFVQLVEGLDWVICGGESGPHARPLKREWVDQVRQQCDSMGVAFLFKQWGGIRADAGGCLLDGQEVKAWPR